MWYQGIGNFLEKSKAQDLKQTKQTKKGWREVFPEYLLCFKFCPCPFYIYYFNLFIIKILQNIIFMLLKKKLRFSKFIQYVPSYQLVHGKAEGKAKICLIPNLFPHGMLSRAYNLSLSLLLHQLLCRQMETEVLISYLNSSLAQSLYQNEIVLAGLLSQDFWNNA